MAPRTGTSQAEAGFSLAEVVVALGILAGVLISMAGVFVLGGHHLASGRNSSEALGVGRDILEEMEAWAFDHTFSRFGADCDTSAPSCTVDSRSSAVAAPWQERLNETLRSDASPADSYVLITLDAVADGGPPAALSEAAAIRVTATVVWREGQRARAVKVCTVRL
jgi:hypothetical protein